MREHHARTDDDTLESLELISDSEVDIKGDSKFVSNLAETDSNERKSAWKRVYLPHRTVLTE